MLLLSPTEASSRTTLEMESTSWPSSTSTATKELTKYIVHIHMRTTTTPSLLLLPDSLMSKLIIGLSLIFIGQYFICICYHLEFLFGTFWVIGILIRVMLNGQLFKGFFNLSLSCRFLDAHYFIIILGLVGFGLLFLLLLLSLAIVSTATELSVNVEELVWCGKQI